MGLGMGVMDVMDAMDAMDVYKRTWFAPPLCGKFTELSFRKRIPISSLLAGRGKQQQRAALRIGFGLTDRQLQDLFAGGTFDARLAGLLKSS
jgi:hypothetical protein